MLVQAGAPWCVQVEEAAHAIHVMRQRLDASKARVLEIINESRTINGLPTLAALPSGVRTRWDDCVITRALDGDAAEGRALADLYLEVRTFIGMFDSGHYPELIDHAAEDRLRNAPVKAKVTVDGNTFAPAPISADVWEAMVAKVAALTIEPVKVTVLAGGSVVFEHDDELVPA